MLITLFASSLTLSFVEKRPVSQCDSVCEFKQDVLLQTASNRLLFTITTAQLKNNVYPRLPRVIFQVRDSTVIKPNNLYLAVVVVAERSEKCCFRAIKMRRINFRWSVQPFIRHRRNFSASAFVSLPSCQRATSPITTNLAVLQRWYGRLSRWKITIK